MIANDKTVVGTNLAVLSFLIKFYQMFTVLICIIKQYHCDTKKTFDNDLIKTVEAALRPILMVERERIRSAAFLQ